MSTPVSWSYGPWRTQQASANPYATVQSAPEIIPGVTAGQLRSALDQTGGGGSAGTPGAVGPAESGPYGTERSNLGQIGGRLGQMGLGMALTGGLPSPISLAMFGLPIASLISRSMGTPNVVDPFAGIREMDERAVRDTFGAFAGDAIARDRAIAEGALRGAGLAGYSETVAGPPGVTNPDAPVGGWEGMSGLGRSGGMTGGSTAGESDGRGNGDVDTGGGGIGGTGSTGGGYDELGGVHKTRPGKPMTRTFGEGKASEQGETGIFVPEYMKQPGHQGREASVEAAMKQLLKALRG